MNGAHLNVGESFHYPRVKLPFAFGGRNDKVMSDAVDSMINPSDR